MKINYLHRKLKLYILSFIFLCIAGSSCDKALDIYVGIPFQPKNLNSEYIPGLNVFGILKTGPDFDSLNYFFVVQKLIHVFDTTEIIEINEADIQLHRTDLSGNSAAFNLYNTGEGKYNNSRLESVPGDFWTYQCDYDTFSVISKTRIPNEPEIADNSFIAESNRVSFKIIPDTSAYLYEVYLLNEKGVVFERIIPRAEGELKLEFNFEKVNDNNNLLYIFAYDKNYERYISTSNIFYKPNAFRPRFSTVKGGYGCFCSTTSIMVNF